MEFAKDYKPSLDTTCIYVDINDKRYADWEYFDEYGEDVRDRVIQNGDRFEFFAC
jgi:hypothetical protein